MDWDKYEHLKKIIEKFVYIHIFLDDGSTKDDRIHDFAVRLVTKLHLVDETRQRPDAKPENLVNNWAITTVRWWQHTIKKKVEKHGNTFNKTKVGNDYFEKYVDFVRDEFEDENYYSDTNDTFKKMLDIKMLIENSGRFNNVDKMMFNLHYLDDYTIKEIAEKLGSTRKSVRIKLEDLISKLRKFDHLI